MKEHNLDESELKILKYLQEDASLSIEELSKKVGITKTPCWKRVTNLHKLGYIKKTMAIVDPSKLGLNTRVLVTIEVSGHNTEWIDSFAKQISAMDEVVRFYRLTGVSDYYIELLLPNIRAYDNFYKALLDSKQVTKVTSMIALEEIKENGIIYG